MEANVKQFLKQSSESQLIFKWTGTDYKFIKGNTNGYTIRHLIKEYPDETKELLIELYEDENTNYHTKQILKEIVKIHNIKK